jgi:glycosyltransferase involved in cell wall biosynthesis
LNAREEALVSCIMPTSNRSRFVPEAIRYFQRQNYDNKELVILDDGRNHIEDLIPPDSQIRYIRSAGWGRLGAKRNACIEECRGNLIMHWDDDDWHSPQRIRTQVRSLLDDDAEICGVSRLLFYDEGTQQTWIYSHPFAYEKWVAGGTLLYKRALWARGPFPDMQVGSDTEFLKQHQTSKLRILGDLDLYVARIHNSPGNTSAKDLKNDVWSPWTGNLKNILGTDHINFSNNQT